MDRILFLLPIAYAGFAFGRWGGLAVAMLSAAILVPGSLAVGWGIFSILELAILVLVGALISLWFEAQEKEKAEGRQVVVRLEAAQRQSEALVAALRENQNRMSAINAISQIVTQSLDLQNILDNALDKVLEVMDLDIGWIYLLDARNQTLRLSVTRGMSPRVAAAIDDVKMGEGLNGRVAASGEPLLIDDVSLDPRLTRQAIRDERIRTAAFVPLQSKHRVLGTLGVGSRALRRLNRSEMEILTAIGNQIGVAVENARLYQEQRNVADQLRASRESGRLLFEHASDAIFVRAQDGRILSANQAAADLAGRSREMLVGLSMEYLLSPEDARRLAESQHKLLSGLPFEQPIELRLRRPDGSERTIEVAGSLLNEAGQSATFQYIARDVTQQRQLQETMRYYARQVTRAQEDERRRIARELHDDTAQALVILSRKLDDILPTDDGYPEEVVQRLEGARSLTDEILEGVRRFSRDLRPSILDDLGLLPALEWLTADLARQTDIQAELSVLSPARRLRPETELVLFRIVQEALSNTRKHSGASRATVTVQFNAGEVLVVVNDNGAGFDPATVVMGNLVTTGKLGLIGMNERASLVGGSVLVESHPGEGTTVTIRVPVTD
jgi:PAS domain S-box-containing protein